MADTQDPVCKNCKFWTPRFVGVGSCRLEGTPTFKFWNQDTDKVIFTEATFGCNQFTEFEPTDANIL